MKLPASSFSKRILIISSLILFFAFLYLVYNKISQNKELRPDGAKSVVTSAQKAPPNKVITRSGRERIFQSDLDFELSFYPPTVTVEITNNILRKIREDSRLLQEAEERGEIELDETVFDSPGKDYRKRIALVEQVKKASEESGESLSGTVVSIWFFNEKAGPLGYEEGKKIAFEKISSLREKVNDGVISIKQAGDIIRSDKSLKEIDPAYETNASFDFRVKRGEQISLDTEFDNLLWQLKAGQVSEVILVKDKPFFDAEPVDAVYMFAKIEKREKN